MEDDELIECLDGLGDYFDAMAISTGNIDKFRPMEEIVKRASSRLSALLEEKRDAAETARSAAIKRP